ncbi:oxidoreductase [Terrihabitans soli]|uniref:Thioredoxin reductase n=1 Tax=Terrihabitans soli TaxID=708113 RepID=A0A6S6QKP2_9HYPH|nr:FAD-dependent oxidoreductase [Terrihabitans soli]BCJ90924.1 oxidoreductase [Terrihabitans soli]
MLDALIIGAGPAGASCALWLAKLGLSPMLVDAGTAPGGLLHDSPYRNDWIVTQPGVTGPDLAEGIGLALAATGVPMMLGSFARSAIKSSGGFEVSFELPDGAPRMLATRNIVIATGVKPRSGGFERSESLLIGPGAHIAKQEFKGRRVAILGGGDNAFENYEFVKRAGASAVHIYARTVRAGHVFTERAAPGDVRIGAYVVDPVSIQVDDESYDLLLVMYGWEPVPVFAAQLNLQRDAKGYISVAFDTCETSLPGVYAIGEVTARSHPSVVTAMADGITAAKAIQRAVERG